MFTKNYRDNLYYQLTGYAKPKENCEIISVGGTQYKSLSGYSLNRAYSRPVTTIVKNVRATNENLFTDKVTGSFGYGVVFGSGNVAPTLDDITLSGDLITGLSSSYKYTEAFLDNCVELTILYTLTNNNDESITIGEIALIDMIQNQPQQYYDTYYYPYLIERSVLETPITIPAGGVGQVTYTIRMNYPTA